MPPVSAQDPGPGSGSVICQTVGSRSCSEKNDVSETLVADNWKFVILTIVNAYLICFQFAVNLPATMCQTTARLPERDRALLREAFFCPG